jgi:hypothetical protein
MSYMCRAGHTHAKQENTTHCHYCRKNETMRLKRRKDKHRAQVPVFEAYDAEYLHAAYDGSFWTPCLILSTNPPKGYIGILDFYLILFWDRVSHEYVERHVPTGTLLIKPHHY